jgi:hypothetical protein
MVRHPWCRVVIITTHPDNGWATPYQGLIWEIPDYKGEAEDMAEVVSLNESVTVASGTYAHCLKIKEWTPLEPDFLD